MPDSRPGPPPTGRGADGAGADPGAPGRSPARVTPRTRGGRRRRRRRADERAPSRRARHRGDGPRGEGRRGRDGAAQDGRDPRTVRARRRVGTGLSPAGADGWTRLAAGPGSVATPAHGRPRRVDDGPRSRRGGDGRGDERETGRTSVCGHLEHVRASRYDAPRAFETGRADRLLRRKLSDNCRGRVGGIRPRARDEPAVRSVWGRRYVPPRYPPTVSMPVNRAVVGAAEVLGAVALVIATLTIPAFADTALAWRVLAVFVAVEGGSRLSTELDL